MKAENPKKTQILKTAKDLFWRFGVKRISVEEICKEANVSKMTFYKFFSNKIELAQFIIHKTIGKSLEDFKNLVNSNSSFEEKVHQMFVLKYEAAKDISKEFVNDIYRNPELGLQKQMEKMALESMNIFSTFLEDSKKKGLIRKEVNIQFIIAYMNNVSQMMDNPEIMSIYKKPENLVMEAMNFCFYGIQPRNSKIE